MKPLNLPALMTVLIAPLLLNACVIKVGHSDDESYSISSYEKRYKETRRKIGNLSVGQNAQEVKANLGDPDFSEHYTKNGKKVTVLYFRTHHERSDGYTSKDECTPLIFTNDRLSGWGDSALAAIN